MPISHDKFKYFLKSLFGFNFLQKNYCIYFNEVKLTNIFNCTDKIKILNPKNVINAKAILKNMLLFLFPKVVVI